tara:strand:+ start:116763 stop:117218 length:456 start_codon:yes stop_codon:yes gene_type:complete
MMGPKARDAAESIDFLQNVFLVALKNLDQLRELDDAAKLRWLTATARNRIRQSARKEREQAIDSLTASLSKLHPATSSADAPPRVAGTLEQVDRLVDVLELLSDDHQKVIELRDFEGLSFHEIGERLGRTHSAVQMLHARALLALAKGLKS